MWILLLSLLIFIIIQKKSSKMKLYKIELKYIKNC